MNKLQAYRGRELFIMGESFGGLLALGTALETTNRPDAEPTADVYVPAWSASIHPPPPPSVDACVHSYYNID